MPQHENVFLFLIGIFTIYLVLAGNRALTFKNKFKTSANWLDKLISGGMVLTSIYMMAVGLNELSTRTKAAMLYFFFGSFGLF
jgi:hypothetical protein